MTNENKKLVVISLLFNVYWLACVVLKNYGLPLAVFLLALVFFYDDRRLLAVPVIALLGIAGDLLLTSIGIFRFDANAQSLWQNLAGFPLWLVFLWFGFASYAWLMRSVVIKHSVWLIMLLCAFAGASSYFAGMRLGAVMFPVDVSTTLILLLLLWAFYGWLFAMLIKRFIRKGSSHESTLSVDIRY